MRAVIVGAGEVGYHLADRLSREGHDICLVERESDRESHLRDRINCRVIRGNGASAEVLEEAGVAGADLFIAVTDVDEVNMVACLLANQYKVPRKIARVKSVEYIQESSKLNAQKLGIELLINPQRVVADEICEMIAYANAHDVAEFAQGRVVFVEYLIQKDNAIIGKNLAELGKMTDFQLVITSITRNEEIIIPTGDDRIQEGDLISLVSKKNDVKHIRTLFGLSTKEARNIFILGAGHVGFEVARRIADRHHRVKIIDSNKHTCEEVADNLEGVMVLCTDATDVETLKEEGIESADAFVAVTNNDQANILGSLLAKKYGVKRAITLVNEPELNSLANSLGVDACVSPRLATAAAILKYIRRGNVVSMVEGSRAEVLEIELGGENRQLGRPLQDLRLPSGSIIGAIVRQNGKDEVIVPSGKDALKAGDHIIVFTLLESVPEVEKFFA